MAADVAELIERSDERDAWLRRVLDAEKRGFALGAASQAGEYERGFADGCLALKAAQHDAHRLAELDARRWSLRGDKRSRDDFGKPPGLQSARAAGMPTVARRTAGSPP